MHIKRYLNRLLLGVSASLAFATTSIAAPLVDGGPCNTIVPAGLVVGTWDIAGSPYCVQGSITVGNLIIGPGVCVQVAAGAQIDVAGMLRVDGTSLAPVTFTEATPGGGWEGIRFLNTPDGSSIDHCLITKATARGMHIIDSRPVIQNTTISDCSSTIPGGGLFVDIDSVNLTMHSVRIENNSSATHGGGVYVLTANGGTLELDNCTIQNNLANSGEVQGNFAAGGIYSVSVGGHLILTNSAVLDNVVHSQFTSGWNGTDIAWGGGVFHQGGDLTLANSVISRNTGIAIDSQPGGSEHNHSYGGGVYFDGFVGATEYTLTMTNCVLGQNDSEQSGSHPDSRGGGVYINDGIVDVRNCTFAHCEPEALYNNLGTLTVNSSIFFFNANTSASTWGNQIIGSAAVDYSDVQGLATSGLMGTGNIDVNPIFVQGATPDGTVCGLQVIQFSSCVDAGDPAPPADDVCFPPSFGSSRNDMGANGGPGACNWGVGSEPVTYCVTAPNSVGNGALISFVGSTSFGANDLALQASPVPAGIPGVFFYGPSRVNTPFGDGFRCVGGQVMRLPVTFASQGGVLAFQVDNVTLALGGQFFPGCTWNIQAWYRDSAGPGGSGFNLSNGLSVTFRP